MTDARRNILLCRAAVTAAIAILLFGNPSRATEESFITIGTGAVTGVYHPAGSAICRLLNRQRPTLGLRCLVDSTEGSIANLQALRAGRLKLGIVQSDAQYHAYHGSEDFAAAGPDTELRALFSLHSETFTVVTRAGSGIRSFDDLKGKRVNIGNPGSGQRATMEVVMAAKGWTQDDFAQTLELSPVEQSQAMCADRVDAIVYMVGHPNRSVLEATAACDSVLVPVAGPEIDRLVSDHPYYTHATIGGNLYRANPNPVPTFGVKATVVASSALPEDIVYQIVKTVFDGFDELRRLHPALARLDLRAMVHDANTAPLHPGAERHFREAGLL